MDEDTKAAAARILDGIKRYRAATAGMDVDYPGAGVDGYISVTDVEAVATAVAKTV